MTAFGPERFENGRPMLLGGLRQRHEFAAAGAGMVDQWRTFLAQTEVPGRRGSNLYGVICGSDSLGLEYMCGIEVESFAGLPEGTGRMRVPAQRYAVFAHRGPASALRLTWQQILEWLPSSEFESAHKPDFEVYGPRIDPLAAVGGIEVWVGVVPRSPRDG
jgi:predicted transcriptional regulator YdeE